MDTHQASDITRANTIELTVSDTALDSIAPAFNHSQMCTT